MTALPQSHHHDHDHTPAPESSGGSVGEDRRVDLKIVAVLFGCTVLIISVIARGVFDNADYSNLLAMVASILLGGPIVYGAAKSLFTGRCSHDHGDSNSGSGHSHAHAHAHDHDEHGHHTDSHMEELVALAIIGSFAMGEYLECAVVAFLMLIASLIEHRTAVGGMKMIESIIRLTPTRALKVA
ncbi:MAG: hypothetical protein AAFX76_13445, partial [Planctomycetota bacterium]